MNLLIFSNNIRYLREKKGVKQAEMLDILGFKLSTWNGYEKGKSTPNLENLIKISEYFGVPEHDLLHTDVSKALLAEKEKPTKGGNDTHLSATDTLPPKYGDQQGAHMLNEPTVPYGAPSAEVRHLKEIIALKDQMIKDREETINTLKAALNQALSALQPPADGGNHTT